MKKSLLALAVLGSLTSAAYAQTSNVTIYGLVDAAITHTNGGGKSLTQENSGAWNGSRLGFKGTEDLGGGLSAIFTLENGFNVDTGTAAQGGALFGRQAFVGLSSKTLGTLTFGRQKTSIYEANAGVLDPFGDGMAGYMGSTLGGLSGVTNDHNFFDESSTRWNNEVRYLTPSFAGFSAKVGYKFGETANNFGAGSGIDVGVNYANGPLNLVFAFDKDHAAPTTDTTLNNYTKSDRKTWEIGGTYDFQVAKVALAYGQHKEGQLSPAPINDRNYMLGVTVPFGAFALLGSYLREDDRNATNADYDRYSLGLTYALSKRTTLYTSAGYEKARNNATGNANLYQVGIDHAF